MRKTRPSLKTAMIFCTAASLLVFINASVWEGAASYSPAAALPETGFYAATNSFPRNTVVEVTNLENGKTVRVIVAGGLDSPGLLTVLSREAAENIGLAYGSIGRVRMNRSADPVARSLLNEGEATSGDPDYDPAAFVAANKPNPDAFTSAEGTTALPPAVNDAPPPPESALKSGYVDVPPETVPETNVASEAIVDVPESYTPPPAESAGVTAAAEPELVWTPSEAEVKKEVAPEEKPAAAPVIAEIITSPVKEPEAAPATEPVPEAPVIKTETSYSLVPSEERPPVGSGDYIDPSLIIAPIENPPAVVAETAPPAPEVIPSAPVYTGDFSVPTIASLEKGKYYVQLGAYSRPDSVESEINRVGGGLPCVVQNAGSAEKPVYRVLIGPVNSGESGALLERFKQTHKDAFVRLGM